MSDFILDKLAEGVSHIEISSPDWRPPYGYYHILKVYEDGSYWPVAFVDKNMGIINAGFVAEMAASTFGNVEIKVHSDVKL